METPNPTRGGGKVTSNLSPKERDISCNMGAVREGRQEAFQAEKLIRESSEERELSTSGN